MPADDKVIEPTGNATTKPPRMEQLAELLTRVAKHRDKLAFEALYRYLAPRLHSYMIGIGANGDLADDLVQETFADVWHKAAQYSPEKSAVSTWVFAIGRNLRIDRYRKVRHFEVGQDEVQPEKEPSEQIDYGRQVDALGLLQRMQQLPQEQFEILRLTYIEGLSQSEISSRLNLPLGTVKSRVRLAFARIRQEVSAL